jgi:hypothetical protein
VITLRREETGVLVMELSEHLWPEDLESAIPVVHDVARSYHNPLLLLVVVANGYDTSPSDVLCQILQPGILAQNRPSRVAVLTTFIEESEAKVDQKIVLKFKSASLVPIRNVRRKLGFCRSLHLILRLRCSINSISRER